MKDEFVWIYGFKCQTKSLSSQTIINNLKSDLKNAQPGEILRFVSGEANCKIYNECEQDFRKYYHEKNLQYEMILGPVVSGCPCKEIRNSILQLAEDGVFKLYLSKVRRKLHMTIISERLLRGELPHPILGDLRQRKGYSIDISKIDNEEKKYQATQAIKNRIREFESLKVFCDPVKPDKVENEFLLVENRKIQALDKKAKKHGINLDSLTREQIMQVMKD